MKEICKKIFEYVKFGMNFFLKSGKFFSAPLTFSLPYAYVWNALRPNSLETSLQGPSDLVSTHELIS
jgi:hypothetical protein